MIFGGGEKERGACFTGIRQLERKKKRNKINFKTVFSKKLYLVYGIWDATKRFILRWEHNKKGLEKQGG